MREIAERFVQAEHKESLWQNDQTAVELLEYVYNDANGGEKIE